MGRVLLLSFVLYSSSLFAVAVNDNNICSEKNRNKSLKEYLTMLFTEEERTHLFDDDLSDSSSSVGDLDSSLYSPPPNCRPDQSSAINQEKQITIEKVENLLKEKITTYKTVLGDDGGVVLLSNGHFYLLCDEEGKTKTGGTKKYFITKERNRNGLEKGELRAVLLLLRKPYQYDFLINEEDDGYEEGEENEESEESNSDLSSSLFDENVKDVHFQIDLSKGEKDKSKGIAPEPINGQEFLTNEDEIFVAFKYYPFGISNLDEAKLTPTQKIQVLLDLAKKLKYLLFEKHIVYTDLTPGNVLIDEKLAQAKLIDFANHLTVDVKTKKARTPKMEIATALWADEKLKVDTEYTETEYEQSLIYQMAKIISATFDLPATKATLSRSSGTTPSSLKNIFKFVGTDSEVRQLNQIDSLYQICVKRDNNPAITFDKFIEELEKIN